MKFIPPVAAEVGEYAKEIGYSDLIKDPGRFIDFYEMRGWQINTALPMKNWKAAVRYWMRSARGPGQLGQASLGALQMQLEKVEDEIREILRPGGAAYAPAPTGDKKKRYEELVEQRHAIKRRIAGYMS